MLASSPAVRFPTSLQWSCASQCFANFPPNSNAGCLRTSKTFFSTAQNSDNKIGIYAFDRLNYILLHALLKYCSLCVCRKQRIYHTRIYKLTSGYCFPCTVPVLWPKFIEDSWYDRVICQYREIDHRWSHCPISGPSYDGNRHRVISNTVTHWSSPLSDHTRIYVYANLTTSPRQLNIPPDYTE